MTEAIDLKAGMVFVKDGKLIKVLESNHHKPCKGNTVMQMKLYDVRSGANVTTTMRPSEKIEIAIMDRKKQRICIRKMILLISWTVIVMNSMNYRLQVLSTS